jgi:uncharacterized protein (DUF58 family)
MSFAEVREYQYGDDVRSIDWNVTARNGAPFVKIFEEERELTVMLVVDVSASGDFGSKERLKAELAVEICALLAFSATKNNDKVGLIIFSDRIEKFVPPRKGRRHVLRVLRELLYHRPEGRGTDIEAALEYLTHVQRKKAVTFLVSDFRDEGFERALSIAGRRHDLVAIRLGDERERHLPPLGYLELEDPETGEHVVVNTSSAQFRLRFEARVEAQRRSLDRALRRGKVDVIDVQTGEPYVKALMRFFRERAKRQ